jgi:hypothetical protein
METADAIIPPEAPEAPLATLTAQDPYLRHPLDPLSSQIRVFTLLPSSDPQAPLQGQLRVEDLTPKPVGYEALSYVWGSDERQHTLSLEGTRKTITDNLHDALRQLRDTSAPRDLWIDAICINQQDTTEKNHQVRQMHDIYFLASRVLIWLGKADADSDEFFSCFSDFRREGYPGMSICLHEYKVWETFFSRPWWRRVWTLQEGLIASVQSQSLVLCGNKRINWFDLLQTRRNWLLDAEDTTHRTVDDFMNSCTQYEQLHRHDSGTGQRRLTLAEMFWASTTREASNPYDYIFALLGPLDRMDEHSFEPDYTKPLTWVFQQAVVSIIATAENLDFLITTVRQGLSVGPSWCLDFRLRKTLWDWGRRTLRIAKPYGQVLQECERIVEAHAVVQHDIRQGTITLDGLSFGAITTSIMLKKEDLAMAKGWRLDSIPWMDSEIGFSMSPIEALDAHNANESGYNVCQEFVFDFDEFPRYVFITDLNIVGAAAQEVFMGDYVALLNGAKLPLVLRRQKDMSYRVIDVVVVDYIDAKSQLDIGRLKTEFVLS